MELLLPGLQQVPRWGTQAFVEDHTLRRVGASTNIAFPLARLGVSCSVIGCVGDDVYGREIVEQIKGYGVKAGGVEILQGEKTGICAVLVREDGERLIVSSLGSMKQFGESNINRHRDLIDEADYLFLADYFVAPGIGFENARNVLRDAKQEGKITLLDTGWDPNGWQEKTRRQICALLRYVDIFLPNLEEAAALSENKLPEDMARQLRNHGCEQIIIKMGREGSLALGRDDFLRGEAFSVEVLDTTGAGDAFDAGVVYGHIKGWETGRTLQFASALAAIVVSKRGEDRYPPLKEIESFMRLKGVSYGGED